MYTLEPAIERLVALAERAMNADNRAGELSQDRSAEAYRAAFPASVLIRHALWMLGDTVDSIGLTMEHSEMLGPDATDEDLIASVAAKLQKEAETFGAYIGIDKSRLLDDVVALLDELATVIEDLVTRAEVHLGSAVPTPFIRF